MIFINWMLTPGLAKLVFVDKPLLLWGLPLLGVDFLAESPESCWSWSRSSVQTKRNSLTSAISTNPSCHFKKETFVTSKEVWLGWWLQAYVSLIGMIIPNWRRCSGWVEHTRHANPTQNRHGFVDGVLDRFHVRHMKNMLRFLHVWICSQDFIWFLDVRIWKAGDAVLENAPLIDLDFVSWWVSCLYQHRQKTCLNSQTSGVIEN